MPEARKPRIRISLKMDQKPACEAPPLHFVRWKLVPPATDLVEREEDPGPAGPLKRTP
jgi:hypothetical protein